MKFPLFLVFPATLILQSSIISFCTAVITEGLTASDGLPDRESSWSDWRPRLNSLNHLYTRLNCHRKTWKMDINGAAKSWKNTLSVLYAPWLCSTVSCIIEKYWNMMLSYVALIEELPARVDGWPVSTSRVDRPCWRVMETSHPSTRLVETGLYCVALTGGGRCSLHEFPSFWWLPARRNKSSDAYVSFCTEIFELFFCHTRNSILLHFVLENW